MSSIKVKRGTRAQIEAAKAANGLKAGEPYLITDENRPAFGTGVATYSDLALKSEVDAKAGTGTANTFSAAQTFGAAVLEKEAALGAGTAFDLSAANYFSKTISDPTTFTLSNVPPSGTVLSFILELTDGGSATVNLWSGIKWAGGAAPALTASGVDILGFYTSDGGTTWRGLVLAKDSK